LYEPCALAFSSISFPIGLASPRTRIAMSNDVTAETTVNPQVECTSDRLAKVVFAVAEFGP
jgi:hypothetical protein